MLSNFHAFWLIVCVCIYLFFLFKKEPTVVENEIVQRVANEMLWLKKALKAPVKQAVIQEKHVPCSREDYVFECRLQLTTSRVLLKNCDCSKYHNIIF